MKAAAARYAAEHGVLVTWDTRPLAAFNDQPLSELPDRYDLVFIDHPTVAATALSGRLTALDTILHPQVLADVASDSVGGSQDTYVWDRHTWAIGVDAACQVAAHRRDLLERLGRAVPRTWSHVVDLAGRHPGAVAMPLYPSDALCSLLSLSAQYDPASLPGSPSWPHPEALALLCRIARAVDTACFELNPPQLLDRMAEGDTIAFAPLVFGYTNRSRPGAPGHRLHFSDLPSPTGRPGGALLGGAGIAVPSTSAHPAEAAHFAAWCARTDVQRDIVVANGGQPASRAVWEDPASDAAVGGFFRSTLKSMATARVRPRDPWWPDYALKASVELHRLLAARTGPAVIGAAMNRMLEEFGPTRGGTSAGASVLEP
ncbi:extracellular solute-binding protein [Wenjunlia tyrosinilytica]|nr:extracellular solute-binding protein [Wenjunlia tyrosinilytica]